MQGPPLSLQMESIAFIILSSALISIGGNAVMADCEEGHFRSDPRNPCIPCSDCPQLTLKTCSETRDTVCGPFKDLQMFHGSNTLKIYKDTSSDTSNKDSTTQKPMSDEKVLTREADERNTYWHTITMVMVAVLCVSGVMFAAFIVAVCYRCRQQDKESLMMQVDKDSDFEKLEDGPTTSRDRPPVPGPSNGPSPGPSPGPTGKRIEQFEIAMDADTT